MAGVRLIAKITAVPLKPTVRHYTGFPSALSSNDQQRDMPRAAVLIIETEEDGVSLYRVCSDGAFAGDTWHQTVEEAKEQTIFEYGAGISEWFLLPDDADPIAFALKQFSGQC